MGGPHAPSRGLAPRLRPTCQSAGPRDGFARLLQVDRPHRPCHVRIFMETTACARRGQAFPGLKAVMWEARSSAAFGEVLGDGPITVGAAVAWIM